MDAAKRARLGLDINGNLDPSIITQKGKTGSDPLGGSEASDKKASSDEE